MLRGNEMMAQALEQEQHLHKAQAPISGFLKSKKDTTLVFSSDSVGGGVANDGSVEDNYVCRVLLLDFVEEQFDHEFILVGDLKNDQLHCARCKVELDERKREELRIQNILAEQENEQKGLNERFGFEICDLRSQLSSMIKIRQVRTR